jgi:hypothetical protein
MAYRDFSSLFRIEISRILYPDPLCCFGSQDPKAITDSLSDFFSVSEPAINSYQGSDLFCAFAMADILMKSTRITQPLDFRITYGLLMIPKLPGRISRYLVLCLKFAFSLEWLAVTLDNEEERSDYEKFGADEVYNIKGRNPWKPFESAKGARKFDVVFDCIGKADLKFPSSLINPGGIRVDGKGIKYHSREDLENFAKKHNIALKWSWRGFSTRKDRSGWMCAGGGRSRKGNQVLNKVSVWPELDEDIVDRFIAWLSSLKTSEDFDWNLLLA